MASVAQQKTVLLFGCTGSGKSTIANMLVQSDLVEDNCFPIGNGLEGVTTEVRRSQGNGWDVIDTVGIGESTAGAVSHNEALTKAAQFLRSISGPCHHILYVQRAGRFTSLDAALWREFLVLFKGKERVFAVVFTAVDKADWWEKNKSTAEECFKGCSKFICVDFPEARRMQKKRQRMRERLIQQLEEMGDAPVELEFQSMEEKQLIERIKTFMRSVAGELLNILKVVGSPTMMISLLNVVVSVAQLLAM